MPRDLFSQPLFSPKLLRKQFPAHSLTPEQHSLISEWAIGLKGDLGQRKEEAIRPVFLQKFFVELLGYELMGAGAGSWTLEHEGRAAGGKADAVLGIFTQRDRTTIAPFELKGPKTSNLDALPSGQRRSPVQQAWDYAVDLPGSQFVLVSNCDEVRLYAMGYGRAAFESWHVSDLLDPQQLANFIGLLHADRFITGQTRELLKANALQEREVTQALYADYKALRQDLILGLHHLNPSLGFADVVHLSQKLIDRLLFIAFAQSRDLLPKGSIEQAAKYVDPYNPNKPRWFNFLALFAGVDKGNPFLKIPPYNGGLFAPDAQLDALTVSDKLVQSFTRLSGYDYEQEVSVTVLGRIFEQSISDLERISQAGDIEAFKLASPAQSPAGGGKSVDGKRKRDGVVYTPDHITRFIVEQTLQPVIVERFELVRARFAGASPDEPWRKPNKEEKLYCPPSVLPEHITEYAFWLAWQQELLGIRVCDPACGSGAFLVAAFDVFKEAYTQLHLKLRELAPQELLQYDISHEILSRNLFGVDINAESIEITKLSLWLKTAEKDRPLAGLEANFYHGNSLVHERAMDALAFDWGKQFASFLIAPNAANTPAIGSKGSKNQRIPSDSEPPSIAAFDVILGNPPYVRQELFTEFKPYLQSRYTAYHGVADLYVYFYELGLDLLKDGGRLGFISSSSFFKTSSGEPLRRLLRQYGCIESLVDFGDWQVFEGVTTYPAIVVMKKNAPLESSAARFVQLTEAVPDLAAHFADFAQTLPLSQLSGGLGTEEGAAAEWQLEGQEAAQLRAKLLAGHPSLKEALGSPYRGVLTGLNEAFVIDRATRDRLIDADPSCSGLLKPFLKGDDIERWRVESQDLWLILMPKGWTQEKLFSKQNQPLAGEESAQNAPENVAFDWLQSQHPALAAHLAPFADAARRRTDQGDYWWELRACAYYDKFEAQKIFYPDICVAPCFYLDTQGYFAGNTGYFLPSDQAWVTALLNSKAQWFLIAGMSTHIRGGYRRMFTQQIETLPIPQADALAQSQLAQLAQSAQEAAASRLTLQRQFAQRILDLRGHPLAKGAQATLGEKLSNWWELLDFAAFQQEVSKRFKRELALRERGQWQAFFEEEKEKVRQLTRDIHTFERSIDSIVYALFKLTPIDIALIERSVMRS
jgi:hypothetical protein